MTVLENARYEPGAEETLYQMTLAEKLASMFHEAYERLAPKYGYKTREESAVPWEEVPAQNRLLMIAVAEEIIGNGKEA